MTVPRSSTSTPRNTPSTSNMSFDDDSQQDSQGNNISFNSSICSMKIYLPAETIDEPEAGKSTYYKRKRNNTDDVEKKIISCIKTLTEQNNDQKCDDADELFAKTITAMLKNFPKNIKNEAKVYIMTYLTDIDTAL